MELLSGNRKREESAHFHSTEARNMMLPMLLEEKTKQNKQLLFWSLGNHRSCEYVWLFCLAMCVKSKRKISKHIKWLNWCCKRFHTCKWLRKNSLNSQINQRENTESLMLSGCDSADRRRRKGSYFVQFRGDHRAGWKINLCAERHAAINSFRDTI